MSKLQLSVAVGNYDRVRPLIDGAVQIDGVDPVFMNAAAGGDLLPRLPQHGFRHLRIVDVELHGEDRRAAIAPMSGVPAFVSRAFRHNSIYVRTRPHQVAGRSQGQARRPARISAHRLRLGAHHPGGRSRREAVRHDLGARRDRGSGPAGEDHDQAAARRAHGKCAGGHDHLRTAGSAATSTPSSRRACRGSPARTIRISAGCFPIRSRPARTTSSAPASFPIMHVTGIRRSWWSSIHGCRRRCSRRFEQSKAKCLEALEDTAATKVHAAVRRGAVARGARADGATISGPTGLRPNRKVLETFLRHHHAQGLSSRLVTPEELFHPSTHESFAI